jgi:hypothetical protein
MKKPCFLAIVSLLPFFGVSQHLTGTYYSTPQLENFDYFKIVHKHNHLEVEAYIHSGKLWSSVAVELDEIKTEYFVKKYGQGKNIPNAYRLKVLLDGLDWEFCLLPFVDVHKKIRMIVVEEIFQDETGKNLLEVNLFEWAHEHVKK